MSPDYRTLSAQDRHCLRAGKSASVFAPDLKLAELQSLLSSSKLSVVGGPTEAGVYTLALEDSERQRRQRPRPPAWQRLGSVSPNRLAERASSRDELLPAHCFGSAATPGNAVNRLRRHIGGDDGALPSRIVSSSSPWRTTSACYRAVSAPRRADTTGCSATKRAVRLARP